MSPDMSYRILADFALDAVYHRLIEPVCVVAWVDSLIAATDSPAEWMIDLSLVDQKDLLAILQALRAVPGEHDYRESLTLLNGLICREWHRGRLTIGGVRGIGWELHRCYFDVAHLCDWGIAIEDAGCSLEEGWISEEKVRRIIKQELSRFEQDVQRLPPWAQEM